MFNEYLLSERSDLTDAIVQCLVTSDGTEEYMKGLLDGHGITWTDTSAQESKDSGRKKSSSGKKKERTLRRRCLTSLFETELSKTVDKELTSEAEIGDIWMTFKANLISNCLKSFDESYADSIANTFLNDIRTSFDKYVNSSLESCQYSDYTTEDPEFATEMSHIDGSGDDDQLMTDSTTVEPEFITDEVKTPAADLKLLQVEEEAVESSAETIVVYGIHSTFSWHSNKILVKPFSRSLSGARSVSLAIFAAFIMRLIVKC